MQAYQFVGFLEQIYIHCNCASYWSKNCLTVNSTWVDPDFFVELVLLYLCFSCSDLLTIVCFSSFAYCIVWPSTYGFWIPIWLLQTFLIFPPSERKDVRSIFSDKLKFAQIGVKQHQLTHFIFWAIYHHFSILEHTLEDHYLHYSLEHEICCIPST